VIGKARERVALPKAGNRRQLDNVPVVCDATIFGSGSHLHRHKSPSNATCLFITDTV
jgi:hypothetical protein